MAISGVVFTGQGSQFIGMGQDFFNSYPESRDVYSRASEALGFDMPQLCFSPNELLDQTEFTQPAILTTEIAIFEALRSRHGFTPTYFAGHSLGEYAALVAAGVLPFEDALKIVKRRGYLMQCAVADGKGAMAALIADDLSISSIQPILDESGADVANVNSKDQIVVSGLKAAITMACERLASLYPEMRIVPLKVSAPFHSRYIANSKYRFERYLRSFQEKIDRRNVAHVLSNYRGGFHTGHQLISNLVRQFSAPVRWMENMQSMTTRTREILEIGPQRVLGKFFSSIGVEVKAITDGRSLERCFGSISAYAA